jgi:hypothetical protein
MKYFFMRIVAVGTITFGAPAIAQVVNGTHGPNDSTPAPIGTKAAGSPASVQTMAGARAAAAARKNDRDWKRGSTGSTGGSSSTSNQSGR